MNDAVKESPPIPIVKEPLPWQQLLARLRATFPVFRYRLPLMVGIHLQLQEQGFDPNLVRLALMHHVRSKPYLQNLAASLPRHDLSGVAVCDVVEQHRQHATFTLNPALARQAGTRAPNALDEITMRANSLKVTAVIADFDRHLGHKTEGAASVPIRVEVAGAHVTASLNPKSFRKAQAAYKEIKAAGGEASVVVSGQLDIAERKIIAAGIAVQPKTPKGVG